MADNGVNVPSMSDLLLDEGQSLPHAKKICTGEVSSSARPASEPVTDPAADPEVAPDLTLKGLESGVAPAPVLAGPLSRLRRNRDVVREVVHNLVRDTQSLVTIIYPDSLAEIHCNKIIARVCSGLRPAFFPHSNRVPKFESVVGEVLRLPRRSYTRLVFQLPSHDDARGFRRAFPMTYHYNGGAVELKLYDDPEPDYTAAKARGKPHLVIRNVPLGYSLSGIRQSLTTSRTREERKWLFDIRSFHKVYDPYEEVSQPQMVGLPIAETDNPFFENIPAVLWLEDAQLPMIINLSCHSCEICTSNHRTRNHQWFAATRSKRLPNRYSVTVAQLHNISGMTFDCLATNASFDMVNQEFLYHCLTHLGLPNEFVAWVRLLHSGTSTQVLVNNLAGPSFPVHTGVRQGCPLAPLLFICVIEALHRHLSASMPAYAFAPAQRRLAACYADDMTLFLNSGIELQTAMHLLQSFANTSGEHPNWSKCSLSLFHIPTTDIPTICPIPIRQHNEAEHILGIYIQSDAPGATTWEKNLNKL
ncbi:unnamed protein product [Closterium sp. NIES-54]